MCNAAADLLRTVMEEVVPWLKNYATGYPAPAVKGLLRKLGEEA